MLSLTKPKEDTRPLILPVLPGNKLITAENPFLHRLSKLTAIPKDAFNSLYIECLYLLAEFVQQLPASEMHHHSVPGGLLRHLLETSCNALTLRRGELLPPGIAPESLNKSHELWTYTVFVGAILHDIGKAVVDQRVTICNKNGDNLSEWNPLHGSMVDNGFRVRKLFYKITFVPNRKYKTHERLGLLIARHIIPQAGLDWIRSDKHAFDLLIALLSGHHDDAGILAQLIMKADGISVRSNIGANTGVVEYRPGQQPLHQKLLTAIRMLIKDNVLPVNRSGAAVFVCGDISWLVCKRVVDNVREYLLAEGHSGIPNSNDRIFDILQEHELIIPNNDRAVWKCDIKIGDKVHTLTMLKMSTSTIWTNADNIPGIFEGEVIPCSDNQVPDVVSETDEQATTLTADSNIKDNNAYIVTETAEDLTTDYVSDDRSSNETELLDYNARVVNESSNTDTDDLGNMFFDWIINGLKSGDIRYNNESARVHIVKEGLFLVSPGIFKDFVLKHVEIEATWKQVQNKFQKIKKHMKSEQGLNIHNYYVFGSRKSTKINGYIIADIENYVGLELASQFKPNPHLKK